MAIVLHPALDLRVPGLLVHRSQELLSLGLRDEVLNDLQTWNFDVSSRLNAAGQQRAMRTILTV
eukprot:CAMPEP_0197670374 /NCGR_PEP_ID=MMETSP1338-20131121/74419_1 /TAXON_ID=43686 ORGANISM="Pelagodinium beii, Strain RCC1491" /NCGR_SAMPLE_ID=MMETSP1338 /ASSEMBLY_ACC=CAM_ASM_000754 /LENGTH=63 /DNA_ID=CAMNT_0043250109 /DNA_START=52 /DNA_END=243 /DNA_ORIENTATION=-